MTGDEARARTRDWPSVWMVQFGVGCDGRPLVVYGATITILPRQEGAP